MISLDFGTGGKLVAWNEHGRVAIPRVPRNTCPHSAAKFAWKLAQLLELDDVVTESATIGSSGAEASDIRNIVDGSPHRLLTLPTRAVKNLVRDRGLTFPGAIGIPDEDAAALLWEIATTRPDSLKVWKYVSPGDKFHRVHTSVRPYDKRDYLDPVVDAFLARLPDPSELSDADRVVFGNFTRADMLPFAMALDEELSGTRDGYMKVIGLYGHGYPSFYRRKTVDIMQAHAKRLCGVDHFEDVPVSARKMAWQDVTRAVRHLYRLSRPGTSHSA